MNFRKKGKKKVVFVKNSYPHDEDPRIIKEAPTLRDAGYHISHICWNQYDHKKLIKYNFQNSNIEILNIPLPITKSYTIASIVGYFLLPIWWLFVLKRLLRWDWDIVHVINFHSIIPSIIAAKIKQKKIVYEIEDTWFDQTVLPVWLRTLLRNIDTLFIRFSDAIILVDEMQIIEYGGIPNQNVVTIYDSAIDAIKTGTGFNTNKDPDEKNFKIFYAGMLTKRRKLNLDKMFEAVRDINGAKLIIAGYGDLVEEILSWEQMNPQKIQFIGKIPYYDMLQWTIDSDLLFVLRDSELPLYKFICGSKIFEAMMCSKPILVNSGSSTAMKVKKEKCGIVVNANNVEEIKNNILLLMNDKKLCRQLGINGRSSYDNTYGWNIMKRHLLELYLKLL